MELIEIIVELAILITNLAFIVMAAVILKELRGY